MLLSTRIPANLILFQSFSSAQPCSAARLFFHRSTTSSPKMQTLRVNGHDMAYLEVGEINQGPPLVCVHGSLCDFRIWSVVLGPLTRKHRVIPVSLRHFFPDHWDGRGDTYSI